MTIHIGGQWDCNIPDPAYNPNLTYLVVAVDGATPEEVGRVLQQRFRCTLQDGERAAWLLNYEHRRRNQSRRPRRQQTTYGPEDEFTDKEQMWRDEGRDEYTEHAW